MQTIKQLIKKLLWGLLVLFSLFLVWLNVRLYADHFDKIEKKRDIILQLNFLNQELKGNNLGEKMQVQFPEGFIFANVLYGLSWCELGLSDTSRTIKEQALKEALYAYNEINTDKAKSIFSSSLIPENGIFCIGWNNYLLSKILLLDANFENSEAYKKRFLKQCETITSTLQNSHSPFLQSYQGRSWPADMCVAMASVSNHDKIFSPKYATIIADWVLKVKALLDPKTKLIPHEVRSDNGATIEGARGCSISLILRLMSEIDLNFALAQYNLYKKNFVSTTLGLPSINEYPKGQFGFGDIDSGPVILGVGFSATIVAIGTFAVFGDDFQAEHQYQTVNAFGIGHQSSETKKYVFGLLPIADAFIAWSRSSGLSQKQSVMQIANYWRLKFHLISILAITFVWTIFYAKTIIRKLMPIKYSVY
jgi:hypothetical protein